MRKGFCFTQYKCTSFSCSHNGKFDIVIFEDSAFFAAGPDEGWTRLIFRIFSVDVRSKHARAAWVSVGNALVSVSDSILSIK